MTETVVVTGLGVVSPLNPEGDLEKFWASLCAGETAVAKVRSFDVSSYACQVAAEVDREGLGAFGPVEEPARRMASVAFTHAIAHAGIVLETYDPRRVGLVVGTVLGGTVCGERYLRAGGDRGAAMAKELERYPLRAIAAHLARQAGCAGPVLTVSTACASGTDALGIAYRRITAGLADVIVTGGVDAVCELAFSGFCALRALTADKVRPFSRNRTGLALGEGAAFLVLESERMACGARRAHARSDRGVRLARRRVPSHGPTPRGTRAGCCGRRGAPGRRIPRRRDRLRECPRDGHTL